MVPLPLFKLAALFVRHISKYGANQIKAAAHDHPHFRAFAARHGQSIHQLNMRLSVASLRNVEAELRAKDLAEAPTVKTKEQVEKEERKRQQQQQKQAEEGHNKTETGRAEKPTTSTATTASTATPAMPSATASTTSPAPAAASEKHPSAPHSSTTPKPKRSVWKRKFRPLPEAKAVALFADVVGDAFILSVAGGLLIFEYWRTSQKPDQNLERIKELDKRVEELTRREAELAEAEARHRERVDWLEEALRGLKDPKSKKPLLPSLQVQPGGEPTSTPTPAT